MLEKVKVTGITFFDGNIDGKDIDSGSVFIEEHLDERSGRSKGTATQKYPLGDAKEAKSLMHNTFPLVCEIEFRRVTNGNVSKNTVHSIKPVSNQPKQ